MDRDALARRNRRLAEQMHQPKLRHQARNLGLRALARIPLPAVRRASNRILIIRPDHLGDVLLAMPAIQLLKRRRPDLGIDLLCGEWSAEIPAAYREIDQVLTLPFPGFHRGADAYRNPAILALAWARRLRREPYDCAFIMRPDHWWGACLAYLAGIPERIGYAAPGVEPFLTRALAHSHQHGLLQNLQLVSSWLGESDNSPAKLSYPIDAAARTAVDACLADWRIPAHQALICIHPGSGASSKLWSAESWAMVADKLSRRYDCVTIFTGAASEANLLEEISAKIRSKAHSSAGATSVSQLAALYQRARLVLGPDSGALHLAAAVGTPTVALFGPADPVEFAPWGDARWHKALSSPIGCSPCRILDWSADERGFHPCVRDITVSQVLEAADQVLSADADHRR